MNDRRVATTRWLAALCLAAFTGLVQAESNPAYWHERSASASRTDWMTGIAGSTPLRDLSLPGTHDTVTGDYTGWVPGVETQTLPLAEQLRAGVRVLDVRCRHIGNAFAIHHGSVYLGKNFDDVLGGVTGFLRQHPRETVLMRVKEEYTPADNTRSFAQTFDAYTRNAAYAGFFWQPAGRDPVLDDARGRIVVLQDFASPGAAYGLDYSQFSIQDDYVVSSIFAQYDKWLKVKAQLNAANASPAGSRPFTMNYLSGSTGVLPYFVASGKVTPGTNDALLLTGLTTPLFNSYYPDFPRVGCFWGICSIAYWGTNPLAYNHITNTANRIGFVGMVMADYPGQGLIDAVIRLNPGAR